MEGTGLSNMLIYIKCKRRNTLTILNFYPVVNVAVFGLGDCPASEFYVLTFRNTLFHLHRSCEQGECMDSSCLQEL